MKIFFEILIWASLLILSRPAGDGTTPFMVELFEGLGLYLGSESLYCAFGGLLFVRIVFGIPAMFGAAGLLLAQALISAFLFKRAIR